MPRNAAARACGISDKTAERILAKADAPLAGLPFSGSPQPQPNAPAPAWGNDQPAPPPRREYDANYHGHTFRSFSAPIAFDGWDLTRVRNAISLHRMGSFLESSTLALVSLQFAPVMAALGQRMAPALALPRKILSGSRGLSRILGERVEQQICPRDGLYPSDQFPAHLFGSAQFDLAMLGFSVWQHVFGEPDAETGIRPLYTRRWPTWAVQYYRYRRTYVALTDAGPIDILNDGKFTLLADSEEPHFFGAILALAEEALDGISTRNARGHYIDAYGNPKWIGEMPAKVAPNSPEGDAMMLAIRTIKQPDGWGVIPNGAKLNIEGLDAGKSVVMSDALASNWQNVAACLLGSDGTMTRGTGVYSAPIFAGVRRDLVDRDLHIIVRGANQGHIATDLRYNFEQSIAEASGWVQPVLSIPLPDPDADARINSYAERVKKFHEIIDKERACGYLVTQERSDQLAASLEIAPPQLAPVDQVVARIDLAPTDNAKVVRVKEARMAQGLPGLGDERDDMTISELDASSKSQAQAPEQPAGGTSGSDEMPATGGDSVEPEPLTNPEGGGSGGETKPTSNSQGTDDVINNITVEAGGHLTIIRSEKDFEEDKHPRAPDGKFGSGGGSGGGSDDDKSKGDGKPEPKKKESKPKKGSDSDSGDSDKSKSKSDSDSGTTTSEKHGEGKVLSRDALAAREPKDKNGKQRYEGFPLETINKVHEFSGETGLKSIIFRNDRNGKEVQTYKYTSDHEQQHADAKFARAGRMAEGIDKLRSRTDSDSQSKDKKTADAAVVTRLIDATTIRVGGSDSEKDTGSVGATTLRAEHVIKNDDGSINLKFPGKSGKEWDRRIEGGLAEEILKRTEGKKPGDRVFGVSAADVNGYLEQASPEKITAKDFRTFHGSALAHKILSSSEPPPKISSKQADENIKRAVEETSKHLGNTPAICKAKYINPRVIDSYRKRVVEDIAA